jgi:hypothetical protein
MRYILALLALLVSGTTFAQTPPYGPGPAPVAVGAFATLFGTGADGNVSISSGTTTLTRDMHYSSLTLSGTGKIVTNGWRVFVSGTLDISAAGASAINLDGIAGNNATGGNGGASVATGVGVNYAANGSVPQWSDQNNVTGGGGGGSTAAGGAGAASYSSFANDVYNGGNGAIGGVGGAGSSAGGAAGAGSAILAYSFQLSTPGQLLLSYTSNQSGGGTLVRPGQFGGGGGGGGGDGTNAGGGGGSSGRPGGTVDIFVNVIARGTNSTAGIISAKAGTSGNGAAGGAGNVGGGAGAGGSGGGFIRITAGTLTGTQITNAVNVSGATGGNGGNGQGTGKGGNGGGGGNGGNYQLLVLNPPSFTVGAFNAAATAGGTTATATGASGGAGATTQGNL